MPSSDEELTDDQLTTTTTSSSENQTYVMNNPQSKIEEHFPADNPNAYKDISEDEECSQSQFADDDEDIFSSEDDEMNEEDRLNREETEEFNKPLFAGARLTLSVSILLIMTFAMRHSLSGEGLKDLLMLIELHCITPNLCRQTVRLLNDFFMRLKSPVQLHFVCSICGHYFGQIKATHCDGCKKDEISYFLVIPIASQLQSFFAQPGFRDLLQYPSNRKKEEPHNIEDVFDGELYKALFSGEFFRGTSERKDTEVHISLQLNTDGVSLFRSSKFSIWPLYMTIIELPPKFRLSRQYRIFAGLWFGNCKPEMCTFLKPLVEELIDLYNNGITITSCRPHILVKAALLSVVCDAPARCTVQNFIQFNGYYGCATCETKGSSVKTSSTGSTVCFPFTDNQDRLQHGHPIERTHEGSLNLAKYAVETGQTQRGVKGLSPLYQVPHFNIIRGVTIDYMHCVLLGVVKMLMHLWLDTKHKDKPFYIRNSIGILNKRILSIKPPKCITRAPSSFHELSNWKASEYRSFLLFYFVPCMSGLLPEEYFMHYLLLVQAIYTLLQNSISQNDLKRAKLMLVKFCASVEYLYGARYETSNVHALLHLCQKVDDLGPLYFHSCFFFEDLNKDLRSFFHGTQKVELQITLAVAIQQQIPGLVQQIPKGTSSENVYNQMTKRYSVKNQVSISPGNSAIGHFKRYILSDNMAKDIMLKYSVVVSAQQYFRLIVHGKIVHSEHYKRVSRRNSFVIKYYSGNEINYGAVQFFLNCKLISKAIHLALIKPLSVIKASTGLDKYLPHYMHSVTTANDQILIPVEDIFQVCMYMDVFGLKDKILAVFPSLIEGD